MSYRFVFGASGAGKSYRIKNEMIQRSHAALDHFALVENYMYIVPEQYTMQTQKDLVLASREQGILNVDVLSFGRLSHRIFEELGAPDKTPLDDVGKSLILRRVAASIRQELPVLGGQLGRLGMISEAKSMISEFMQYDLGASDVRDLGAYAASHGQGALATRLADLAHLYEEFCEYEQERFMTGEETLDLLSQMIPQSRLVQDSVIVFDGFTGFTPVQYRVITALMRHAREVIFTITIGDDGGPSAVETEDPGVPIEEQDLFYLSRKTIRSIMREAQKAGVEHGEDMDLTGETSLPRFAGNEALRHFERSLFHYPVRRSPCKEPMMAGRDQDRTTSAVQRVGDAAGYTARLSAEGHVRIYQATTPEEEVREMCIRIRTLIREKGYAYRDCSIVCADLNAYEDALDKMAAVYELPIYIDSTRAILRNPLTESIRAVLAVTAGDYSYETMFRYLRAGLSGLTTTETDRLENYCLAQGVWSRKAWETPIDEIEISTEQRSMEELRQTVMAELAPLRNLRGKTAGERTGALYEWLVGVRARARMLEYAARFGEAQDFAHQKEYEQIYRKVIELLDQIYALIGEETISAKDYLEIIETGFEEIRLGVLPQMADRIIAGDMERSRMPEGKVLFFLGANDGNVPRGTSKGGLISDLDREFLAGSDAELSPTPREQMYIQRLYLYLNLTKATDLLTISFAKTAVDGASIRPSYLVHTIRQMYTDVVIETPEVYETPAAMANRLVGHADARQFLAGGIRQFADGQFDSDPAQEAVFKTVYGFLAGTNETVRELLEAAFLYYRPRPINKATAEALYGRILRGSVTRFETAAQCYLRHYLQYGLRLRERDVREFESRDAGSILHESVQRFAERLQDRRMDWRTFTQEEGEQLADEVLSEVAAGYDHQLAYQDARTQSVLMRMRRILHRTVTALQYQIQQGDFTPALFEAQFGMDRPLRFSAGEGREVHLIGRIDRVDLCEQGGRVYVKIVDYKSGRKDLDPRKIMAGLQLQLPLYMDAAMDTQKGLHPSEQVVPAGMLYYHFDDPILSGKKANKVLDAGVAAEAMDQADAGETTVPQRNIAAEQEILMELRPKGCVNSDPQVLACLDKTREKSSSVIPVTFKVDGSLSKSSSVYSTEEFEQMMTDVRGTVCHLAERILTGENSANPVILDSRTTACTYCAYREVCGFDRKIPGYQLHDI